MCDWIPTILEKTVLIKASPWVTEAHHLFEFLKRKSNSEIKKSPFTIKIFYGYSVSIYPTKMHKNESPPYIALTLREPSLHTILTRISTLTLSKTSTKHWQRMWEKKKRRGRVEMHQQMSSIAKSKKRLRATHDGEIAVPGTTGRTTRFMKISFFKGLKQVTCFKSRFVKWN